MNAINTVQAVAPQELTSQVETASYTTPAMSFGEVGEVYDQQYDGYANYGAGVAKFENTKLLERMIYINSYDWAVDDLPGLLISMDVDNVLRLMDRNASILDQFSYYRADYEVTIRINTNQFYYGALMVTLFPTNETGTRQDERAVLDPTVISANCAESVVKTIRYPYPMLWKPLGSSDVENYPINLRVDVLAPLTRAKQDMPDTVSVQVWARFVNIELSYPRGPLLVAQSGNGPATGERILSKKKNSYPKVSIAHRKETQHPSTDKGRVNSSSVSEFKTLQAIEQITVGDLIGDAEKAIKELVPLCFFDKPDRTVCQEPIINESCVDMYNCDLPDSNPVICLNQGRYVDPGPGRMPMTKNFTIADYARIPGLRGPVVTFDATGDIVTIPLIQSHADGTSYAIPLDYAYLSSCLWRGSIKMCLQFFTSAFISARFALQMINTDEYSGQYPIDYSNGISKVINVKGDTVDTTLLPWLSKLWWSPDPIMEVRVKLESRIASSDVVSDPKIYMICWVAGGDDIQFSMPTRLFPETHWSGLTGGELQKVKDKEKSKEKEKGETDKPVTKRASRKMIFTTKNTKKVAQSAIGSLFLQNFTPVVPNVAYDIDNGYCTNDQIGLITSVCKRYSHLAQSGNVGFSGRYLDETSNYGEYWKFRQTYFGSWRSAFLFRSGGYKWRCFNTNTTYLTMQCTDTIGNLHGVLYREGIDKVLRLTVPQLTEQPFCSLTTSPATNNYINIDVYPLAVPVSTTYIQFLAARDDLQLGFPILPKRWTLSS